MAEDERPDELEELRWNWAESYSIAEIDGEFCATRREGHNRSKVLRADTVDGLRREIVADYAANGAPERLSSNNYSNEITTLAESSSCQRSLPSDVYPATEAAGMPPAAANDELREIARHLQANSPNWLVLWGAYTQQFVAFPRFDAPPGTIVTAIFPDALVGRTREVERRLRRYREQGEK